jgi:hypothetical protein
MGDTTFVAALDDDDDDEDEDEATGFDRNEATGLDRNEESARNLEVSASLARAFSGSKRANLISLTATNLPLSTHKALYTLPKPPRPIT